MAEFVSFRPGDMTTEITKRGDNASKVAKDHLRRHFESLAEDRQSIWPIFQRLEMQFICAALFDVRSLSADNILRSFKDAITPRGYMPTIAAKFDLKVDLIATKLSKLSFRQAFAIVDIVEQLRQIKLPDVMGGLLPKPQVLQTLGAIAPDGPVAWGICVIVLPDFYVEQILRVPLEEMGKFDEDGLSLDELMQILVDYTINIQHSEPSDGIENRAYRAAYAVARKTGYQRFRISGERADKPNEVQKIEARDLASDLHDRSMEPVALSGVNAE